MKKRTVRIISAMIAGLLVFTLLFAFVADIIANAPEAEAADEVTNLNNKLSKLAAEKEKIKKELNRIEEKKQSASAKKAALDQQIDVTQQEIDTLNQLIDALDQRIEEKQKELEEAEALEKKQTDEFLVRLRVMEEEGSVSMLGVILSADSFTDMITRTEIMGDIVEGDRTLMRELAATREKIASDKAALDADYAELESAREKLVSKRSSLKTQYNEANALVKELSADAKEYEKKYNEAEAAQEQVRNDLKKILSNSSSKQTTYVGGTFMWPTKATRITSYYGRRKDPITKKSAFHTGIDIGASSGSDIYAANSGTVVVAGWSQKGYGNYVVIDHGGGKSTLYAHMKSIKTTKGATVAKGEVIGYVGTTGYSTGPHLHFEILINGDHTNPMNYFNKA